MFFGIFGVVFEVVEDAGEGSLEFGVAGASEGVSAEAMEEAVAASAEPGDGEGFVVVAVVLF